MYFVYVLQSQSTGHFYTGFTSNLEQRVLQHNRGVTKSTKHRVPWRLVHHEPFVSRSEAIRREKFLKSGRGREELSAMVIDSVIDSAG